MNTVFRFHFHHERNNYSELQLNESTFPELILNTEGQFYQLWKRRFSSINRGLDQLTLRIKPVKISLIVDFEVGNVIEIYRPPANFQASSIV
mgnify:CR=1 FL=1